MRLIPPTRSASIAALLLIAGALPAAADDFRPPAVPLVTHDPYFSVWSTADRPTDDWSRHWTGAIQAMAGMVRVDGAPYRLLGTAPASVPAAEMAGLEVTPTRTVYTMEAGAVRVTMTFCSPLLPDDLGVLARPVTYLTWDVQATDGGEHEVALYFDATAEWAVNTADQRVTWDRPEVDGLDVLRIGTVEQPVLAKAGDNLRIDWGHLYVAAPSGDGTTAAVAGDRDARDGYAADGSLPAEDDDRKPRAANDDWPVLAFGFDLGKVGAEAESRHLLIAYDEEYGIEYFGERLRPYWRRDGLEAAGLLEAAEADYESLLDRCRSFDEELTADLEAAGGREYALLSALAYRECLAAHTLVDGPEGQLLMFSKENFSNGCIGTVDVMYPAAPLFLLLNPDLMEAQVVPVLDYARSGRWTFPFAPHDLGTYPKANGQVYGGGERSAENQMPVEECGNLLILVAAIAEAEGNADLARDYWPLLTEWAEYLRAEGLDPENQLCTDDFAGHLAHNTNLSLKAIVAIGGYAKLAEALGKADQADAYRKLAAGMADRWVPMADDGDHFRLAFDKPGTWSQKYNLVWDKLLNLDLFPPEVARKELAFYLEHQNEYGLPLDNRSAYTKLDWIAWTATLSDSRDEFEALLVPAYKFADETPDRVPLSDWYWTDSGKHRGFQARSVVGGLFIKPLAEPEVWRKWVGRGGRRGD